MIRKQSIHKHILNILSGGTAKMRVAVTSSFSVICGWFKNDNQSAQAVFVPVKHHTGSSVRHRSNRRVID